MTSKIILPRPRGQLIASVDVTGDTSAIDVTLPDGLLSVTGWMIWRAPGSSPNPYLQFNGDTGANYSYQSFTASDVTLTGARTTGATQIQLAASLITTTTTKMFFEVCALAGNSAVNDPRVIRVFSMRPGTLQMHEYVGAWASLAQLASMRFFGSISPAFAAGSKLRLWGEYAN